MSCSKLPVCPKLTANEVTPCSAASSSSHSWTTAVITGGTSVAVSGPNDSRCTGAPAGPVTAHSRSTYCQCVSARSSGNPRE